MRKEDLCDFIEERREEFISINDAIWSFAEVGFEEVKSSELLIEGLKKEGFEIERNVAGMETAFTASYGKGKPVIAILGEYDALPGLSQKKSSPVKEEDVIGGSGHGCGHNVLGAGSYAATIAVKEYLKSSKLEGTVIFYGCPAEENGSGKTFMVRDGLFDHVDLAFCWHPSDGNGYINVRMQACMGAYFRFKGQSSHAAASPHLGRSALDSIELMNVGANYLREHIPPYSMLHYAITDSGGRAPNVVQERGEVHYYIRAKNTHEMMETYNRLCDVAKGAALMTGTELEIEFAEGLSDYIPNKRLGQVLGENFLQVGPPQFDEKDEALALEFRDTLSKEDILASYRVMEMLSNKVLSESMKSKVLNDSVLPYVHLDVSMAGSTDVGDVSYVVPTAQISTACCAIGTVGHSWQFTSQMASSIAHKGMLTASKVMAMSVVDVLNNPSIIVEAKEEHNTMISDVYVCPIPDDIKPNTRRTS